ncbi:MAG: hypothetical protein QHJ34_03995 [bacterium]|jgi:hypothetical protein|nr:hypothetical protein [candidate division KSB1 bacterium]MDH7559378.1 hypothetical protein [bacterium]
MVTKRSWLMAAIMLGSLWGMAEVLMDATLAWSGTAARAVVLPSFAVMLVGMLHVLESRPGAILVAGLVAAFFKFLNVPFFGCQIFAVVLLAFFVEVTVSVLGPRVKAGPSTQPLLVGVATWFFFLLFALIMTYVVRYHWWTQGGLPKIMRYVLAQGGLAAIVSSASFRLGQSLARSLRSRWAHVVAVRPAYSYAALVAVVATASAVSLAL